ncbi:hypothetical protein AAFF_G00194220 [Aldrovandia affinis]|uniref:Uncharacterized protein n=1 Tax=Aldrovandia affinis TaxID=143900 RepID=A0AAD7WVI9_9TELE|nr:hypothetical protein AAFF_G00194220 [Aldrovandia affinis]
MFNSGYVVRGEALQARPRAGTGLQCEKGHCSPAATGGEPEGGVGGWVRQAPCVTEGGAGMLTHLCLTLYTCQRAARCGCGDGRGTTGYSVGRLY